MPSWLWAMVKNMGTCCRPLLSGQWRHSMPNFLSGAWADISPATSYERSYALLVLTL